MKCKSIFLFSVLYFLFANAMEEQGVAKPTKSKDGSSLKLAEVLFQNNGQKTENANTRQRSGSKGYASGENHSNRNSTTLSGQPLKNNGEEEIIIDFSSIDHTKEIGEINEKINSLFTVVNRRSTRTSPAEYIREMDKKQDKVSCDCDQLKKKLADLEAQYKNCSDSHTGGIINLQQGINDIRSWRNCCTQEMLAWGKIFTVFLALAGQLGAIIWLVKG